MSVDLLKTLDLPGRVMQHVTDAYKSGYSAYSDGITCAPDMGFAKHPLGVMHDYLYALNGSTGVSRRRADQIFRDGIWCMCGPGLISKTFTAHTYYLVLRVAGRWAWKRHTKAALAGGQQYLLLANYHGI